VTHLCVPIFVTDLAQAKRDIAAAAEAGADMVELRLDRLKDFGIVPEVVRESILPVIATDRPTWEGGHSDADDAERMTLLMVAGCEGAKYIDIELQAVKSHEAVFRKLRGGDDPREINLILSFHDFSGRPAKLYNIVKEMDSLPADIDKLVWTARTIRDNAEVFELIAHRQRPMIALCMGEAGLMSRVLAKKFGGFLTFASLDSKSVTAPGQVSINDLKNLYRWDAINEKTKVFGVVANPVAHSMSPAIHNAAFDATSFDGVYLPMLVDGSYESFKAFMETFAPIESLHLSGLSVTIPHKGNALRYLKEKGAEIEDLAQLIGAVNTIAISQNGPNPILRGWNTDYAAIVDSITDKLGIKRENLSKLRVGVIGAGGTGRTAVAALAHFGAIVMVSNRTHDRAAALAAEFNGRRGIVAAISTDDLCRRDLDVVINTTSVGMHPNIEANPAPDLKMTKNMVIFDTVYNPAQTKFLQLAEAAGARTIGGIEMFVRQATSQFTIWTGIPAPREIMHEVVVARLKS